MDILQFVIHHSADLGVTQRAVNAQVLQGAR